MSYIMIMYVIMAHWVADFVLQSNWMATNKSSNIKALSTHVTVYIVAMTLFAIPIFSFYGKLDLLAAWSISNAILHFGIDYITSKVNSEYWNKEQYHNFFVSLGFDQVLHYASLFSTLALLI
jgi:hypothetical protein